MRLSALRHYLMHHPLTEHRPYAALTRFVRWQAEYRLLRRTSRSVPWLNRGNHPIQTQLLLAPHRHSATANYYVGLQEYEDMALVLHALRTGDMMLDIGANIGAYSLLAASTGAQVIAVEPSPENMAYLENHIRHNSLEGQVQLLQVGIAAEAGELPFIEGKDSVCRIAASDEEASVVVPVQTLDSIVPAGTPPSLIKIDVEGFEPAVIAGAQATLAGDAPMIIITEANGQCSRYGLNDTVDGNLRSHGFVPCSYEPETRALKAAEGEVHSVADNAIYVRNIAFFQARVKDAPVTRIHPVDKTI